MNQIHEKIGYQEEFELQNTSKEEYQSPTNQQLQKQQQPKLFNINAIPKRIIAITVMLTVLGITFIILGILLLVKQTQQYDQYLPLLFIGTLMIIPGIYYSYKLIIFAQSKSRIEQEQIIQELPIEY